MAPIVNGVQRSSLSRLQALDTDFENAPQRLQEAAVIAGLGDLLGGQQFNKKPKNHSRSEWVLRWLTNKLKLDDDVGSTFRASPLSWRLLTALVQIVPESTSAKLLSAGEILFSVRKALDEWLQLQSSAQLTTSLSNPEIGNHRGLKRKRDEDQQSKINAVPSEAARDEELYTYISEFLSQIITSIKSSEALDVISREHLKTLLRVKEELAAEILSSWMRIIRIQLSRGVILQNISLQPYRSVWDFRAVDADLTVKAPSLAFANDCLIPAVLLYSTTRIYAVEVPQLIHELEDVIANQLLLPSKAAFFTTKQQRHAAKSLLSTVLVANLAPLKDAIDYCRTSGDGKQLEMLLRGIPYLFELSIKHTKRSTPKQRHFEAPWLQTVFTVLSNCGSVPLSIDASQLTREITDMDMPSSAYLTMEVLLQTAKRFDITLSTDLLRTIVSDMTGLKISTLGGFGGGSQTIHWELIVALMELDGSIFLPVSIENVNGIINANVVPVDLSGKLIDQISRLSWDESERLQKSPNSLIDKSWFISNVVVKYIKVFASYRRLSDFIDIWNAEIVKKSTHLDGKLHLSVWASNMLVDEAQESWEALLTPLQFKSLLEQFTKPLQAMIDTTSEQANITPTIGTSKNLRLSSEATAAAIILDALLAASTSHETLSMIKPAMYGLFTVARNLLELGIVPTDDEGRLWRILTRIQERLLHCEEPGPLFRHCQEIVSSKLALSFNVLLSHELKTDTWTRHFDAISFFLAVCLVLDRGTGENPAIKSIKQTVADRILSSSTSLPIMLLIKFPEIIQAFTKQKQKQLFKSLLRSFHRISPDIFSGTYEAQLEALQESIVSEGSYRTLCDWTMELLDGLEHIQKEDKSEIEHTCIMGLLMKLPEATFRRQDKAKMIDKLVGLCRWYQDAAEPSLLALFLVSAIHCIGPSKMPEEIETLLTHQSWSLKTPQISKSNSTPAKGLASQKLSINQAVSTFEHEENLGKQISAIQSLRLLLRQSAESPVGLAAILSTLKDLESATNTPHVSLASRAVLIAEIPQKHEVQSDLVSSLKGILPKLAESLSHSTNPLKLGHGISDILTILQSKHSLVSQYGVERVIATLIHLMSASQYLNLGDAAGDLYIKLCKITNTLLSLHLKYIKGRVHLLVPLLQQLITSLFQLHPQSKPSASQKPPNWLPRYASPLSTLHGTSCARILLTWVNPTVSSTAAARRGASSLLTDETRKARHYAAQYVPYILTHFCSLHLVGRLTPEIRKAILPGIWACIEAVPREALRGMNASMGRDERAIWASLWGEWCRVHGHSLE